MESQLKKRKKISHHPPKKSKEVGQNNAIPDGGYSDDGEERRKSEVLAEKKRLPDDKVFLSIVNRASDLILTPDYLGVFGFKGYRSVLASHPVIEGSYYVEIKFEHSTIPEYFPNTKPHIRIGIAPSRFNREYVLGYDSISYSYRDLDGAIFNNGNSQPYGEPFTEGDIIGVLLHMEPLKPWFEHQKNDININEGSTVYFFKNGKCQGEAWKDLIQDFYHVGVSLYMNAEVKFNFGPTFDFPPELPASGKVTGYKPYSCLATEPVRYSNVNIKKPE